MSKYKKRTLKLPYKKRYYVILTKLWPKVPIFRVMQNKCEVKIHTYLQLDSLYEVIIPKIPDAPKNRPDQIPPKNICPSW